MYWVVLVLSGVLEAVWATALAASRAFRRPWPVVVFAVSGINDKGEDSAIAIDSRTLATAEEAFCARNGRYAEMSELVSAGLLSEKPSVGQRHVSLNPRKAGEIRTLIDEGALPPGLSAR